MTDKLLKTVVYIVESRSGLAFNISGVVAYVFVSAMWDCIILKFGELPVALSFLMALSILATGYWGAFSFAKITYSCVKKRGYLLGGLLTATFLIANKFVFMHTDDSVIDSTIRSLGMLGVGGAVLGFLLAWSSSPEKPKNGQ